jgi:dTDP-4-amino-4,6-dideoxygalactose transaminase
MADMESIMDIASRYNLKVIEDATEALGTKYTQGRYSGKYAGTIGDFGAYSFNGNKIITTGGGGAVTSNKPEVVDHLRFLSTQAKTDSHYYIHDEIGYNYRMTNIQAAIGVAQLENLGKFVERKNKFHDVYLREFKDFKFGKILGFREGTLSNKWFLSLCLDIEHIDCETGSVKGFTLYVQDTVYSIQFKIHNLLLYLNIRKTLFFKVSEHYFENNYCYGNCNNKSRYESNNKQFHKSNMRN